MDQYGILAAVAAQRGSLILSAYRVLPFRLSQNKLREAVAAFLRSNLWRTSGP